MARKPFLPCRAPGCPGLGDGVSLCPQHLAAYRQREAQREAQRKAAVDAARPSAAHRGYNRNWQRLRRRHLAQEPLCVDPFGIHGDWPAPATDVHHILPLAAGGANDADNLQSLCHSCHSRITARDGAFGGRRGDQNLYTPGAGDRKRRAHARSRESMEGGGGDDGDA